MKMEDGEEQDLKSFEDYMWTTYERFFFLIKCKNIIDQKDAGDQQYIITDSSSQEEQTPLAKHKQAKLAEQKRNKLATQKACTGEQAPQNKQPDH
jgi:hypothetical protein